MYYRSRIAVTSREGIYIDAFSLWERKGDLCILVDEDQYVSLEYTSDIFEPET